MKVIKETCYKGTRILLGNEKQTYLSECREELKKLGFAEIQIPIIQHESIFQSKIGQENNNLMYTFKDRGNRDLCLAPEYTSVVQQLAQTTFKNEKDVKLFYVAECFRGEKPQKGRYRQFTQLGVEILNPTKEHNVEILALDLCSIFPCSYLALDPDLKRGLDYYKQGKGFEITSSKLNLSVCGGGEYENGVGFAIGVDRIMEINTKNT